MHGWQLPLAGTEMQETSNPAIAVIGMAARFPDAADVQAFWLNLVRSHEALTSFSDEELLSSGVPPTVIALPEFVRKASIIEGADLFDAGFFGFNPREAELIDPQQRVLLECAWEAMEDSGYGGGNQKNVGVYAGAGMNSYIGNLFSRPSLIESSGLYQLMISSDKDFLASRIGYKLDLRGPCITLQTACSTSLVAVHVACQALLARDCDMALAGGVSLHFPQKTGYLFQEGMIFSPDGHCRPFDAEGRGIRNGEGAGIVVLKRLDDARRDGDSIRGVILGTAVNNDGADKIGYTAPSVDGQAKVLSAALAASGVDSASITYIEAHGTATPLGDTIEFAALSKVYGGSDVPCTIGAVKSNIGHLDVAAGAAGLIKSLLALHHRSIPPTLHFRQPNPQLQWESSRFHINTATQDWPDGATPRRAAVSSFGIGGTNAHVVLEEAPQENEAHTLWPQQLLIVSAVTASALNTSVRRLASHLKSQPDASLDDVCYTLQVGRKHFPHRRALVCSSLEQLKEALQEPLPKEFAGGVQNSANRPVAFMFTGQGAQYQGMGRDLYSFQPTFRQNLDLCADLLHKELGVDLRELLYGSQPAAELNETRIAQPALFALEFALARMWMHFGVTPVGMIGHSLGEFVAACLAGVFTLEDALRVVAFRGQLMQSMPRGSMLSIRLSEEELRTMIDGSISIAAVNSRSVCAVSGPEDEIEKLQRRLESKTISCARIHTSHAFHSSMMEPAMSPFRDFLAQIRLERPKIPFISNVTGGWISPGDAVDPNYWARHLREKVQFGKGIRELAAFSDSVLLEVGPGNTLGTLAREAESGRSPGEVLSCLPHAKDPRTAAGAVLSTLAALWLKGVEIDWEAVHEGESLHRISLPTYPFERGRFFVEPAAPGTFDSKLSSSSERLDFEDWFHVPSWKRTISPGVEAIGKGLGPWLIFADTKGLADAFTRTLSASNEQFVRVNAGSAFSFDGADTYVIDPGSMKQYRDLLGDLIRRHLAPRSVLFGWTLQSDRETFHNLVRLAQAFGEYGYSEPVDFVIVSAGMYKVHGDEDLDPELALLLGPCKTIPIEYPNIKCRNVDLCMADGFEKSVQLLSVEPAMAIASHGVAYRRGFRWEQYFESVNIPAAADDRIRSGGVYVITGGMGGIGLTLARYLASFSTRLALIGRTPLPVRDEWQSWLETHPQDDRVSALIREFRELEGLGAEVLPLAADVSNEDEMRRAVGAIHQQLGPIDGIVHSAGIAGGGLIQIKSAAATERVLAPKVKGTQILASLTGQDPVDFFVLCSSVNSIVGMIGGVDYTAANAYLDVFAAAANQQGRAVVMSIDWDAWQEVGMAVNTQVPREMQAERLASLRTAIRSSEGVEVFRRVLAAGLPQVAVVTRDVLCGRNQTAASPSESSGPLGDLDNDAIVVGSYARPDLLTPFQAPQTEVERTIAKIWQEALGQTEVGLDDNFFDLGGHSLIATSILSRIRNAFNISLPLRVIFETPTVRALAEHVDTLLWNGSGDPTAEDSGQREEVEI
jgi:acyl transferase domain-containing protein/acyl carrier protein